MEPLQANNRTESQGVDDCAGKLPPLALRGIQLFNEGKYFEAHEELEAAWRQESRPIRQLYQGILQVGVAYLHIRNGNLAGAKKMLLRSKRWLAPFPEICQGVRVGQLRRDAEIVEQALKSENPALALNSHVLKSVEME